MDDPAEKAQHLSDIAAVLPNVFLGGPGVDGEKCLRATGFGKDVSRMAQLGSLDDRGGLEKKDVLVRNK